MTCNLKTLSYSLSKALRTVRTEQTLKPPNHSKNIRAKQGNILSVDNDMQFMDRKLCLTDRQKLYGLYKLNGLQSQSTIPRTLEQSREIL